MVLTIAAITLEQIGFHRHRRLRDQLKLILWGSLENFGYRQLTILWRLCGLFNYLRRRTNWGEMERRGFSQPAPTSPDAAREPGQPTPSGRAPYSDLAAARPPTIEDAPSVT